MYKNVTDYVSYEDLTPWDVVSLSAEQLMSEIAANVGIRRLGEVVPLVKEYLTEMLFKFTPFTSDMMERLSAALNTAETRFYESLDGEDDEAIYVLSVYHGVFLNPRLPQSFFDNNNDEDIKCAIKISVLVTAISMCSTLKQQGNLELYVLALWEELKKHGADEGKITKGLSVEFVDVISHPSFEKETSDFIIPCIYMAMSLDLEGNYFSHEGRDVFCNVPERTKNCVAELIRNTAYDLYNALMDMHFSDAE